MVSRSADLREQPFKEHACCSSLSYGLRDAGKLPFSISSSHLEDCALVDPRLCSSPIHLRRQLRLRD